MKGLRCLNCFRGMAASGLSHCPLVPNHCHSSPNEGLLRTVLDDGASTETPTQASLAGLTYQHPLQIGGSLGLESLRARGSGQSAKLDEVELVVTKASNSPTIGNIHRLM